MLKEDPEQFDEVMRLIYGNDEEVPQKLVEWVADAAILITEDTGVDSVIWVGHKCPERSPFVIAEDSTGKVLISIDKDLGAIETALRKWIVLNKDLLLAYWNDDLYPTSQMLRQIKKLS